MAESAVAINAHGFALRFKQALARVLVGGVVWASLGIGVAVANPVTLSGTLNNTLATTIQGHLNNGDDVIVDLPSSGTNVATNVTIQKTTGTDATLTLRSNTYIHFGADVGIVSTSGKLNIVLWSSRSGTAGSEVGIVRLGSHTGGLSNAIIDTNGGHLWVGGGSGSATWNGLTVGDGYARGSFDGSGSMGWFGIELYGGSRIFTRGGNVAFWGASNHPTAAIGLFVRRSIVNSGSGAIELNTLVNSAAATKVGMSFEGDGGFSASTGNITITNTIQGTNTNTTSTGVFITRDINGIAEINSASGTVSIENLFNATGSAQQYEIDINETAVAKERSSSVGSFTEPVPLALQRPVSGSSAAALSPTYSSANTGVATINATTGEVSVVSTGSATLTGAFTRTDWNHPARWRYAVSVVAKSDPQLTFPNASVTKVVTDPDFTLAATGQSGIGTISYTSSNRAVATVNGTTGEITLVAPGTSIITATSASNTTYAAGLASYTLTVSDVPASLLNEPFTGATLNNPSDWIASAGGTLTEWPCLTHATQATQVSVGTVEACVNQVSPAPEPANYASTLPVAAGEGSLRLTRRRAINDPNLVAGSLLYARELSASEGLDISFSIRMEDVNVADGMSFFLKDGASTDNSIGAAGGALGYGMSHPISGATILDPPNGNGVPGAILGIGFDKWGNFSWNAVASSDCATRGTHTSQGSPPASAKNQLVLRGPDTSVGQDGSSGYCYLGAQAVSYSPSSFQRVRVVVPPYTPGTATTVEVYLAPANDPTNLPVSPTLTQAVTLTATSFKFGFSGSTGWYSNNHDLRGLLIEPAGQALWWPAAVASSAVTGSGTGPTSGGTLLTITGTSFNAGATVTVGGNPCTDVSITGGSQLTCTAPAGSLGAKEVVVTNPTSTPGYGTFTYINPTPTVTAITPSSGAAAGGNTVTITGTGFVDGATVSLGGSSCTSVSVLSATSLSCVAPAGSGGAVVDVVVTNLGPVSGTGLNLYTYNSAVGEADVTKSLVTASPTSVVADGQSVSTITIQLVDANDNLTDRLPTGQALSLVASNGSLQGSLSDQGNGLYTQVLRSPTTVGSSTLTASIGSAAITAQATVAFVAGVPSQIAVVSGNNQQATVDQTLANAVTVKVTDAEGNAISNAQVSFTGTGSTTPADGLVSTDAQGQASVNWRLGTNVGAQTLTASLVSDPSVSVSIQATASAGVPAKVVFTKVDDSVQLGPQLRNLPFSVKVAFLDAFDNPTTYTGSTAELVLTAQTLNAGQGGAEAGELRWADQSPATPVSLSVPSGTSSLIFTDVLYTGLSGATVGQDVVLEATGSGGLSSVSTDSQGFSVRDIKMTIVAESSSLVADGESETEITVTLTDADDVAQPDQNITVETSLGAVLVNGAALSNPLVTDANGEVSFVLKAGTVAGDATVTARCPGACPVSTVVVFVGNVAGLIDQLNDPDNPPTTQLYEDAGITGVDADNLLLVNELIDGLPAAQTATPLQLQASIDALNEVLANADGDASTTPNLNASDYQALGLSGIANGPASVISLMNSVIGNQAGMDGYSDLVALADVVARISQALQGQRPEPGLTPADFALIGIEGVDYANLSAVLAALGSADLASLTTLAALQALINDVPPPLPVSVMNHPLWWVLMVVLMLLFPRRIPGTRQMLS